MIRIDFRVSMSDCWKRHRRLTHEPELPNFHRVEMLDIKQAPENDNCIYHNSNCIKLLNKIFFWLIDQNGSGACFISVCVKNHFCFNLTTYRRQRLIGITAYIPISRGKGFVYRSGKSKWLRFIMYYYSWCSIIH